MSLSFSYAILEWARTKPAEEAYNYFAADHCLVAQFGLETGRPGLVGLLSDEIDAKSAEVGDAVIAHPWTFGAFAKRLEGALA